jgi:hypothetical protein
MFSGILFITGPWISIIIVYDKYFDLHKLSGHSKDGQISPHPISTQSNNLTFSDAIIPLIVMQSSIILIVLLNCYNLLKEVFRYGILSWHRDNFGSECQVLSFHICLLITWCNLYNFLTQEENNNWKPNVKFVGIFNPIYVFFAFYLVKLLTFNVDYTSLKILCFINFIAFVFMANTLFDYDASNNIPI